MYLHVHSRETTGLSGTWSAVPDPYRKFGEDAEWGGDRIFDPEFDTGQPDDADLDAGYDVSVPGCWNEQLPAFEHYEGAMWYARRLDGSALGDAERAFLRFGAVNYRADVWLDGTKLGHHEGGFTPFAFEVTDQLDDRPDHLLVVKVDNDRTDRKLPAESTDWFNFGGITREVDLVGVPERFCRNCKVETDVADGQVAFSVTAWVDGPDDGDPPEASLPELDRTWTLDRADTWASEPHAGAGSTATGTRYEGTVELPEDEVERWSPGDPRLYDLDIRVGEDAITERVGVRTVSVDGSDVLVNGEPVDLRGISMHEEADGRGRSLTPVDRRERFEWAADLGCTFLRLAHYPHHRAMARRADEEGLLLWEEVPAYWSVAFGEPAVQENYRQQLRELIQRDWNRPSVLAWSIANETDAEDDARNAVLSEMAAFVRDLDPTRLVTAACFMSETDDGGFVVDDPLADHLDLVGINQYHGWYEGEADDFARFESDTSGPPIVISEVGAGAKRGHHGEADEVWTEEHQAEVYRQQLAAIDGVEQVAGLTPWICFDFRSPRRQNPHQRGYNRKGLLDPNGKRKAAFEVLRRYYERRAEE